MQGEARICESILRLLPQWFGIEESLMQYVADTARFQTVIAAGDDREPAGFLSLRRHFTQSSEIHCMAVRPDYHRRGIGRNLVNWTESTARQSGAVVLQVKTLGPSRPDPHYESTRGFYQAVGFTPLEEFHGLWERNPCLVMVKWLK